jgi:SAM-dependent methyltransferase
MKLQEKAQRLQSEFGLIGFTGGPVKQFEKIGRSRLIILLEEGVYPDSKVLDIGCGALRGGYWIIHFLNPGCYFGIEPNKKRLQAGIEYFLEPELLDRKKPKFNNNARFDLSVFQEKFDFIIARSILTHTSKIQIQKLLDSFINFSNDDGVLLASYLSADLHNQEDYQKQEWSGPVIYHSFSWIQEECGKRNLSVKELKKQIYNKHIWLKITKNK